MALLGTTSPSSTSVLGSTGSILGCRVAAELEIGDCWIVAGMDVLVDPVANVEVVVVVAAPPLALAVVVIAGCCCMNPMDIP